MREGLDLDSAWTNSYDPVERWWGVEVEFPSTLDEVFGVTNNKQNATVFSQMAQFDWRAEANAGESLSEFRERIKSEGDTMVSSAYEAARADLAALAPPQGLTEDLFTAYIAGILRQMPILVEIDRLAASGLTDAKAHDFLADSFGEGAEEFDPDQAWRVIKEWLIHFFPEAYRLETGQEVLVKGRELPRR